MSVEPYEIVIDFSQPVNDRLIHSLLNPAKEVEATFVQGDKLPVNVYFINRDNGAIIGKSIGGSTLEIAARYKQDETARPTDLIFSETLVGEDIAINCNTAGNLYGGLYYDNPIAGTWVVNQEYYVTQGTAGHKGAFFKVDEVDSNGKLIAGHISRPGVGYAPQLSIEIQNPYGDIDLTDNQTITATFNSGELLRDPPLDYTRDALFIANVRNLNASPSGTIFHTGGKEKKLNRGRFANGLAKYNNKNVIRNDSFQWSSGSQYPDYVKVDAQYSGTSTITIEDLSESVTYGTGSGPANGLSINYDFSPNSPTDKPTVTQFLFEIDPDEDFEPGNYTFYYDGCQEFGEFQNAALTGDIDFSAESLLTGFRWMQAGLTDIDLSLESSSGAADEWDNTRLTDLNTWFARINSTDTRPASSEMAGGFFEFTQPYFEASKVDLSFHGSNHNLIKLSNSLESQTSNFTAQKRPKYLWVQYSGLRKLKFTSVKLIKKTPMEGSDALVTLNSNTNFKGISEKIVCTANNTNYFEQIYQTSDSKKYIFEAEFTGVLEGNPQPSLGIEIERDGTLIYSGTLSSSADATIFTETTSVNTIETECVSSNQKYSKFTAGILSSGIEDYTFKIKGVNSGDHIEILYTKLYLDSDINKSNLLASDKLSSWTANTGQERRHHLYGYNVLDGTNAVKVLTDSEAWTLQNDGLDNISGGLRLQMDSSTGYFNIAGASDAWYKVEALLEPGAVLQVLLPNQYNWQTGTAESFASNLRVWTRLTNSSSETLSISDWFFVKEGQSIPTNVIIYNVSTTAGAKCLDFYVSLDYDRDTTSFYYHPRKVGTDDSPYTFVTNNWSSLYYPTLETDSMVSYISDHETAASQVLRYICMDAEIEKNVHHELRSDTFAQNRNDFNSTSWIPFNNGNSTENGTKYVYNKLTGWHRAGGVNDQHAISDGLFGTQNTSTQYNDTTSSGYRKFDIPQVYDYSKVLYVLNLENSDIGVAKNNVQFFHDFHIAQEGNGVYLSVFQQSGVPALQLHAGAQYSTSQRHVQNLYNIDELSSPTYQIALLVKTVAGIVEVYVDGILTHTGTIPDGFPGGRFGNNDEGGILDSSASYALPPQGNFNGELQSPFIYIQDPNEIDTENYDIIGLPIELNAMSGVYKGVIDLNGAFVHAFFDSGADKMRASCDIQASDSTQSEIATLAQFKAVILPDVNFNGSNGAPP